MLGRPVVIGLGLLCRTRVDDRLKLVQNGCGRVESKVRRMSGERGGRRRRYREFGIEMVQAGNAVGMPDERRYLGTRAISLSCPLKRQSGVKKYNQYLPRCRLVPWWRQHGIPK